MAASVLRLLSLLVFVIGPLVLLPLLLQLLAHPIIEFRECLEDCGSPSEHNHKADHGQEEEHFFKRELQESLQQLGQPHLERLGELGQGAQGRIMPASFQTGDVLALGDGEHARSSPIQAASLPPSLVAPACWRQDVAVWGSL